MTLEELYKKEFGDADSVPKESVIRLLQHFAAVLKKEREEVNNLNIPDVSGSLPLDDFINEVERMQKLYSNSKYTSAEELRDKLAEQLDDIMRLGGNDR